MNLLSIQSISNDQEPLKVSHWKEVMESEFKALNMDNETWSIVPPDPKINGFLRLKEKQVTLLRGINPDY